MAESKSPGAVATLGAIEVDDLGRDVCSTISPTRKLTQALRAELIGSDQCSAVGITATGHAGAALTARPRRRDRSRAEKSLRIMSVPGRVKRDYSAVTRFVGLRGVEFVCSSCSMEEPAQDKLV